VYWFIYGYIVWSFLISYTTTRTQSEIILGLHSTHHAPEQMNLSVTYAHFILEGLMLISSVVYLHFVWRKPAMLFAIMFIDVRGGFIHVAKIYERCTLGF